MWYLVLFALLVAALAWFFLGGRGVKREQPRLRRPSEDVDYDELEQAEREVQEAADESSVRDWGPGTGRSQP